MISFFGSKESDNGGLYFVMVKRETVDYISYDDLAQVKQRMVDDRGVKRQKVARKMGHLEKH